MDPIPHNFYYDPTRQGVGSGLWNWFAGKPYQSGSYLTLTNGEGYMYYDCGKGNLSMTLNVPTNTTGGARQWGFRAGDDYVLFDVGGGTLQGKTSSTRFGPAAQSSSTIPWDPSWTGADTTFMIRWEAGFATFYINGQVRSMISDASVPYGPLSPYISTDNNDLFMIKNISGQGLQTLILSPVEAASDSGEMTVLPFDKLTVSEAVTVTPISIPGISGVVDTLANTESANVALVMTAKPVDTLTNTDVIVGVTRA